jgi:hypothetical protein
LTNAEKYHSKPNKPGLMLYLRIIKAIALLYFLPFHLSCQLWISSEFRPRIEYRDGYRVLPESNGGPSCLASFRTRLDISCRLSKFSFNLLPQDTRSINGGRYLESTGLNTPNTGLNLREAWVSFSPDDSYTLKIGRQEAYLNDQRLMAKRNWSQDGIGYDMIRFDIHKKNFELQAGFSYNIFPDKSLGTDYPNAKYKTFSFINLKENYADKLELAFISVLTGKNDIDSLNGVCYQNTSGILTGYNNHRYGIHASFYMQWGKNYPEEKVLSYLTDIHGIVYLKNLTISSGIAIISGNHRSDNNHADHTFDLLYGARHSYYGLMDHFSKTDEATNNSGLIDGYLSLTMKNTEKISFECALHAISAAGDYYQTDPRYASLGKYLATETDFTGFYQLTDWLLVEAGYCFLIPSGTYQHFVNSSSFRSSNFAFLMITFSHVLFEHKSVNE